MQRPGGNANIFANVLATRAEHSAAFAVSFSSGAMPKSSASSGANQSEALPVQVKTHRLLVVDDDAGFRESLCFLLKRKGYPAPLALSLIHI